MTPSPIVLLTNDTFLGQLITLELADRHGTVRVVSDPKDVGTATVRLIDADAFPTFSPSASDIVLSRSQENSQLPSNGRSLRIPFPIGALSAMLKQDSEATRAALCLTEGGVIFKNAFVPLTSTEYALAAALIHAGGAYVARKELAAYMGEGTSDNALNVYIHYLRRKLEASGDRVITSSRSDGYRIEPNLLEKR